MAEHAYRPAFQRDKPQKGQNARHRAATDISNPRFSHLASTMHLPQMSNGSAHSNRKSGDNLDTELKEAEKGKDMKSRRSSALQMDFSKNQDEQLKAIKKEVDWLKKEVPHFTELYDESQAIFAHSQGKQKRTKAETESFALIQSLTAWVHEYGSNAVKEYDDLKNDAEDEIRSLVGKLEKMTQENKKLELIRDQNEHDKEELQEKLAKANEALKKIQSSEQEMAEKNRAMLLNQDELGQLQQEVDQLKAAKKTLSEKYERVQQYWKMTQDENDELRKKTSGFESEVRSLREQNIGVKQEMQNLKAAHRKQVQQMEADHQSYAEQMRQEQEKLMESAHAAASDYKTGGGGGVYDDDDNFGGSDGHHSGSDDDDHFGKVMSLGDDMNAVYEYEDDDWLDEESDSFSSESPSPEPPKEPTPPPKEPTPPPPKEPTPEPVNQQDFFETEKTSMYQDLVFVDASLTFSEERLAAGEEETRQIEKVVTVEPVKVEPVVVQAPPKEESPEPKELFFEKGKHLSFSVEETRVIKKVEDYSMTKAGLRSRPHLFPIRVQPDRTGELETKIAGLEREMKEQQAANKQAMGELEKELEKEFQSKRSFESELERAKQENQRLEAEIQLKTTEIAAKVAEVAKLKEVEEEEPKEMQFSSAKTGPIGQRNMMVDRKKVQVQPQAPVKVQTVTHIIDKSGDKQNKEMIMGGTNFAERMAMFQTLAKTKGGKPQVLPQAKAYGLINKLATRRNLLVQEQAKDPEKKDVPKLSVKVDKVVDDLEKNKDNVHMTHKVQTSANGMNVFKITKCTRHLLKPRLCGFMQIVKSSFIPRWKMTQQPRYFFVLDALPSETNTNQNEPDFAKNRKHDHLVPTLFFFASQEEYDDFYKQVKDIPTREVKFQKLFAKYAKGTYPLSVYALDLSVENCTRRLKVLLNIKTHQFPKQEIQALGDVTDLDILCCKDTEIHKFSCNDKASRDKWVRKVNKLVDKRATRLAEINSGLFGVVTGHNPTAHKHDEYDKDVVSGIETAMRPTMVHPNAPSGSALLDVDKVEPGFD